MLAFDQGDLAAQRLERLGHLDADQAAADDDHAPGDLLGGRRVAVCPQALNLLKPFDGGDQGHRAAGQDHRPPGFELLVPDHDASFAGEPPTSANKRHPVGRHPGHQVRVVGRAAVLACADDLVAPAQHGATSRQPFTASRAPRMRRASPSASYGRRSAFEGRHAQWAHSPPMSRSSTPTPPRDHDRRAEPPPPRLPDHDRAPAHPRHAYRAVSGRAARRQAGRPIGRSASPMTDDRASATGLRSGEFCCALRPTESS
jgi:hypothetical protein